MLEAIAQRFQGSCMMVMRRQEDEAAFLGSSFLVHSEGYLLTTARAVADNADLFVVPPDWTQPFAAVTRDEVAPIPVEIVARDVPHDVALLKLVPELDINMPDEVLGSAESDPRGTPLMSLGVPFGYYRIHTVIAAQSILAGRITSRSGTRLIIFDRRIQFGDIGGPLVSSTGAKVIGVVGGVFDPVELEGLSASEGVSLQSNLSFAMDIEYGAALLRQALAGS